MCQGMEVQMTCLPNLGVLEPPLEEACAVLYNPISQSDCNKQKVRWQEWWQVCVNHRWHLPWWLMLVYVCCPAPSQKPPWRDTQCFSLQMITLRTNNSLHWEKLTLLGWWMTPPTPHPQRSSHLITIWAKEEMCRSQNNWWDWISQTLMAFVLQAHLCRVPRVKTPEARGPCEHSIWPFSGFFEIYFNGNSHLNKTKNRGRRRFGRKELVPFR